jgi:hypothetical protein
MPCPAGGEGRKPSGDAPLLVRPDAVEEVDVDDVDIEDVDKDENELSSDRCISGSGAAWVFRLASGLFFFCLLGTFREKGSAWDAPGLPLGPLWALGASSPCVVSAGGRWFS